MRWVDIGWENIKSRLVRLRDRLRWTPAPEPPLLQEFWQIHEHLACLENQFNHVDHDLVEYVIFKLNASERLMATVWQAARREGLVAWEDPPEEVQA